MNNAHSSRIKCIETSGGIEIIVRSDKNWFLVIAFAPFIFLWFIASIFVGIGFVMNSRNGFPPIIWICGWLGIGILIIRKWLWNLAGRTEIYIVNSGLVILKKYDIFSKAKRFELEKIKNLHIQNKDIERTSLYVRPNYLFTDKTKTVAFEYEGGTIQAVDWLNASDADFIMNKLSTNI